MFSLPAAFLFLKLIFFKGNIQRSIADIPEHEYFDSFLQPNPCVPPAQASAWSTIGSLERSQSQRRAQNGMGKRWSKGNGGSGPGVGRVQWKQCMLNPDPLPGLDLPARISSFTGAGPSWHLVAAGAHPGEMGHVSPWPEETSSSRKFPAGCNIAHANAIALPCGDWLRLCH